MAGSGGVTNLPLLAFLSQHIVMRGAGYYDQ